ncbi:MAG TPA: peptidase, partial [Brevundimonas sp.]
MLRKVLLASVAGLVMLGASAQASTQATGQSTPATAAATAAWQDGLFGVRLDREKGRVLARLSPPDAEGVIGRYLYQPGLSAGLGMDNAGLDRSGLGQTQIVAFH